MNNETEYTIDSVELALHAREIGDLLFGSDEMAMLEKKLPTQLQRAVSNIFHAYEQSPQQRRELEQRLGEIQDRELGVAILQRAYLIRSERTVESVVPQLVGLANSRDRRTSQSTLQALREAAYSQIPRLQELGCRALFETGRLDASELLGFASNIDVPFQFRLEAVEGLLEQQSPKSVDAFKSVIVAWLELDESVRPKHTNRMYRLGDQFEVFVLLPEADEIVMQLYDILQERDLGNNDAKRMVQRALASLPQETLAFLDELEPNQRNSSAVFTMATIAYRSSEATLRLLSWLEDMLEDWHDEGLYRNYVRLLSRTRSVDSQSQQKLEVLIERLTSGAWPDSKRNWVAEEVVQDLQGISRKWKSGGPRVSLRQLLREMAADWQTGEAVDLWSLRHAFRTSGRQLNAANLSDSERDVIVETLRITSQDSPWRESWKWLAGAYPVFRGNQRLVVLEALGHVARQESGQQWDTEPFQRLREFFTKVSIEGDRDEAHAAQQWLEDLQPPGLPTDIRRVDDAEQAKDA